EVAREAPDEGRRRDVEAFRDEARWDADVEAAGGECVDHPLGGPAALDDVAVQPPDPEPREPLADLLLHPFRPAAGVADRGRLAVRAAGRDRRRPPAVVAAQARAGLVVHEG